MNIKHLLYRFYKGFPARVALLAYPVDGGVILFHIPLIALSGALAITSIDFILKGISILLSSKNDRYLKALAIKSLIQDNLATN